MKLYPTVIVKGWWVILAVIFSAGILLGQYVPEVEVHAGTSVLLDRDDPDLAFYNRTRPLWGYDEYAILCFTGDEWVSESGIALTQRIVDGLKAVPHAATVVSILDIPLLRQDPGPFFDPSNVPDLTSPDLDLDRARAEILDHTQAKGNLISGNGRSMNVLVYLDIPEEAAHLDPLWSKLLAEEKTSAKARAQIERLQPEMDALSDELGVRRIAMIEGLRGFIRRMQPDLPEPIRMSGISFINVSMLEHLNHDLRVFGIAAFLLFTLGFLLVYRKTRFVLMPIITCLLPVALVLGAMVLLDMRLTLVTANLPVLLFTLMLPYTVYFMERYRERRRLFPEEAGELSTASAAQRIWIPCLYSCATTIAGFLALMTSTTKPVHDFGLMTAIGMAVGLIIVFLVIPSMSRPLPPLAVSREKNAARATGIVRAFERLTLARPGLVVMASAVLLAVSAWGASRLSAQSKFTEYFHHGSAVYEGLEYIDTKMGGTTPLEVMLESEEPQHFLKPKGLKALNAVQDYFKTVAEVGNVRSMATLVDELIKKNPAYVKMMPMVASLPLVRSVTKEFADETYSKARVIVRFRETAPTLDRNVILEGLRAHMKDHPDLAGLKVRETGAFLLYANMLNTLMRTQKETFLYVVIAIYLMVILLFRSPLLALILIVTQVLPAVVMLGVMGWLQIPLDLITVMIASIAMGIGIDASIQYTFRYRRELAVDGDHRGALSRTHATIGRAIWVATSVIIAGFCVLALSDFRPSMYFGLFTAIAMLMSQLAALTVLPAIFLLTGQPKPPKIEADGDALWR